MGIIEEVVRHSASRVNGRIINTVGDEWQAMTDTLGQLAIVFGSVVKIQLAQSATYPQWLNFEMQYDHVDSATKFCNHIEVLGKVQPMAIVDCNHLEIPPPPNNHN